MKIYSKTRIIATFVGVFGFMISLFSWGQLSGMRLARDEMLAREESLETGPDFIFSGSGYDVLELLSDRYMFIAITFFLFVVFVSWVRNGRVFLLFHLVLCIVFSIQVWVLISKKRDFYTFGFSFPQWLEKTYYSDIVGVALILAAIVLGFTIPFLSESEGGERSAEYLKAKEEMDSEEYKRSLERPGFSSKYAHGQLRKHCSIGENELSDMQKEGKLLGN